MPVTIECRHCGKTTPTYPSRIAKGQEFCSGKCAGEAKRVPVMDRFWPKVDKDGALPESHPEFGNCWSWTSTFHDNGYGRIYASVSEGGGYLYAHRLAFQEASGIVLTSDDDVCHTCDVPACVRNEPVGEYTVHGLTVVRYGHLFLSNQVGNNADRDEKRRVQHGERGSMAKLTDPEVLRIYDLFRTGLLTQREIAGLTGVSEHTISDILTGTTWRHLSPGNIKHLGRDGRYKITPEIRAEILSEPRTPAIELMRKHGISRSIITMIRRGEH